MKIQLVLTSGIFAVDRSDFDVEKNVWTETLAADSPRATCLGGWNVTITANPLIELGVLRKTHVPGMNSVAVLG